MFHIYIYNINIPPIYIYIYIYIYTHNNNNDNVIPGMLPEALAAVGERDLGRHVHDVKLYIILYYRYNIVLCNKLTVGYTSCNINMPKAHAAVGERDLHIIFLHVMLVLFIFVG